MDLAAFLEHSKKTQANFKWAVTPLNQVAEGHIVVIHFQVDGPFQSGATSDYDGVSDNVELHAIQQFSIFHFDKEGKIDKLVNLFDVGSLKKQLGL